MQATSAIAISAEVIALDISSRNARVLSLQNRWNRLREALERLLDERGADMAEIPGGSTGILCKDYKSKEAEQLVTRIDPGVVSMAAELRAHERQAAEELDQWHAPPEPTSTTVKVTVEAYNLALLCTPEQLKEMEKKAPTWPKSQAARPVC